MPKSTRYTHAALAKMKELGATKTGKELGVSVATLYEWRRKQNDTTASPKIKQPKAKKAVTKIEADTMSIEAIKAQLAEDDGLHEKVRALEAENSELRKTIAKLKKLLLAAID
ncbi:MAG: hypothetical protein RR865_08320 [Clostridia bacterium]